MAHVELQARDRRPRRHKGQQDRRVQREAALIDSEIGEHRIGGKEPGKLEFPDLKITLAASSIATWAAWFDDFVIKGNNGSDKEKNGRIVFLTPDVQTELGEIKLIHVGIFRLDPDADDPSSADKIARFTAELYVEQMQFNVPPAPVTT